MYAQYCLGVLMVLCLTTRALSIPGMMPPVIRDNSVHPLTAKDTTGHFPGLTNTIYPGMLPPGYTYTRRVRTSGNPYATNWNYMPGGFSYSRRIRTSGFPLGSTVHYPSGYTQRRSYRYNNGFNDIWPMMMMADNM